MTSGLGMIIRIWFRITCGVFDRRDMMTCPGLGGPGAETRRQCAGTYYSPTAAGHRGLCSTAPRTAMAQHAPHKSKSYYTRVYGAARRRRSSPHSPAAAPMKTRLHTCSTRPAVYGTEKIGARTWSRRRRRPALFPAARKTATSSRHSRSCMFRISGEPQLDEL
jgi:hypothetical protein